MIIKLNFAKYNALLVENISDIDIMSKNDIPTLLKVDDEIGLGGCVYNGNRQDLAVYLVVREK